jgi:ABC-type glycerol-3-phosphate transport system substrate-binding protein
MKHKFLTTLNCALVAVLLVAALAGCAQQATPSAPTSQPPAEQPTQAPVQPSGKTIEMSFTAWSYGVETVADNIKNFEAMYPNVKINFQDFSWLDYHGSNRWTSTAPMWPHTIKILLLIHSKA